MALFLHEHYMRMALNIARRGLGRVAPNPTVGCVIVQNGRVVGRGWTADGGRPHAETVALQQADYEVRGATVYVTLEPCAHYGETPPCAQSLIDAGVRRVVIACTDPDSRVSGRGIEMLKGANIDVVVDVLAEDAHVLNEGFMLRVLEGRPFVTLKSATSADGKIAPESGKQQWVTGKVARQYAHLVRSQHDAILVGIGTVIVDDPSLTTRLPGYQHNSLRVVLDGQGRLPKGCTLQKGLVSASNDVLVLTNEDVDTRNIRAVLKLLAERGITRLLVEGGAKVNSSFLKADFCDQFLWFKAPLEIGEGGVDAIFEHDIANIEGDFGLEVQKTMVLGEDSLEIYRRKA